MTRLTESDLEEVALGWLDELGYSVLYGPDISPDSEGNPGSERNSYSDVILLDRMFAALGNINPDVHRDKLQEAAQKVLRAEFPALISNNRAFHRMLVDGIRVSTQRKDGTTKWDTVKLIDFDNPKDNDWLAVNQFTIVEGNHNRRPDIILFVNGLPLAVIELKNPTEEKATVWNAFNQLQLYKKEIEPLFVYNEVLVASDGLKSLFGSLTANKERFMPWKTIEGEELAPATMLQLEVMVKGLFSKERFLDYIRNFVVFEDDGASVIKKIAGYHQFHAVNKAIESAVEATSPKGDKRCGVIWHTQGSGKSLSMVFFSGKIIQHPALENPTIIMLTDRNDLDDQLFGTFSRCHEIIRQKPVQADKRSDLREKLKVASGGVVFTTIQKFLPEEKGDDFPVLSERRNIIVIADEAHRSQYDFIDGFARHMRDGLPNASFIGFTGTPLETQDRVTRAVFGEYISIYDIQRAVEDGATVPIYYEARVARLHLSDKEKPKIDPEFDEITEKDEESYKYDLKRKWAALEKVVGSEKRLKIVAKDLIDHWEKRSETIEGKAMVVCMSRRICADMYKLLTELKPDWHHKDDDKGVIKVVMTGSASDPEEWHDHVRTKSRREALGKRFKDPKDPFKIVIVRDMWLTGFDAPSLHTMYLDKPMHSHTLMQAIARVNRVYKDKPGGLIVDYLGMAEELRRAMANYTESGGKGNSTLEQEAAVKVMLEKYEICRDMYHGFDYLAWKTGNLTEKLNLLPQAQEHILQQEDGRNRYMGAVSDLTKAFALSVPHESAMKIRDEVGFFQAVRTALAKQEIEDEEIKHDLQDAAIRQLVSRAVASDKIIDIFAATGLKRPDVSILSDEFLNEVKKVPQKNLAIETLKKLLSDEIKERSRKNLVQSKKFSEMLEDTIKKYRKKVISSVEVLNALFGLAHEMRDAYKKGEELGLSTEELAFYDALEVNDSAIKVLGDEVLRDIAIELVNTVKRNVSIDWTVKENVRAKLRVMIKRVLKKHNYPPDKQEKATETVLKQAELLAGEWAVA